jgi:hypothetical protein
VGLRAFNGGRLGWGSLESLYGGEQSSEREAAEAAAGNANAGMSTEQSYL